MTVFEQAQLATRIIADDLPTALEMAKKKGVEFFIWNHKVYKVDEDMLSATQTTIVERDNQLVDECESSGRVKTEMTLNDHGRKTVAGY